MILASAIIPLLVLFGTIFFITESPRFLEYVKSPKIIGVLNYILTVNGKENLN
jgi:hypothetical protein